MKSKIGLLSYSELKQKITNTDNPIAKHLGSYLYAACARKGEITRPDYSHAPKRIGELSINADDVFFKENSSGKNLLRLRIKTTKTGSKLTERIVPLNPEKEQWLCDILINWKENHVNYLAGLRLKSRTQNELFPFSAAYTYYLIKKNFGFNPHLFRAMRATHYLSGYVTGKPMSPDFVARIGGWSSIQTLYKYYSGVMMSEIEEVV